MPVKRGYGARVSSASGGSKAAIAAEVWATLLEVVMGQRNRFFSVLGEFGLSPGDLRALSVLELERSRPMGSLAHAWDCDPSNVTWMVDRLEERGLVERRVDLADRRVKTVALTALGARTKTALFARLHQPPDELLTLDRKTLQAMRASLASLPASLRSGFPSNGPR
jgi:MarR family transcriptional regulator, organic hydroperoxide resistance regulator